MACRDAKGRVGQSETRLPRRCEGSPFNCEIELVDDDRKSDGFQPNREEAVLLDRWNRLAETKRNSGAPRGNQNRRTSAIYVNSFLTNDEAPLFESILQRLNRDFVFNQSSDLMQVELVGVYFLRLARAQAAGDSESAERFDRMIRSHLKDLKTTKLAREGDQPKGPDTSPAEWATKLLERAQRDRKRDQHAREKQAASEEQPKAPPSRKKNRSSRSDK